MLQSHALGFRPIAAAGEAPEREPDAGEPAEGADAVQTREPEPSGAPSNVGLAALADFARVYEEHFAFAWRSLRLLGVAEDQLEDAAQDVFEVASRQLPEFAGRSTLRTWIFSIVQRTAANYRRRHRRKLQQLVPLRDGLVATEPTPHAHVEARAAAQRIERYAEGLDADRRALFVLVLLEEVPAPEAARAFGLPLNTVYSRIRSLRAGLERALAGEEVSDE